MIESLQNRDLEHDVLSGFIAVPNAIYEAHEVTRDWFYFETSRLVFDVLQHCVCGDGFAWNHLESMIGRRVENTIGWGAFGTSESDGVAWYTRLTSRVVSSSWPWRVHVAALRELYLRRSAVALSHDVLSNATEGLGYEDSFDEVISRFVEAAGKLVLSAIDNDDSPEYDAERYLERVTAAQSGDASGEVTPTHIVGWDSLTGGVTYGRFVVIAAKPKHGKTSLILRAVFNLMHIENYACDFYSAEMSRTDVVDLFGTMATGYRVNEFRENDGVSPDTPKRGRDVIASLDYKIFVGRKHIREIENNTRARVAQLGGSKKLVVVVDYLQLFRGDGDGRTENIENISMRLAAMSHELPCLVIAAAQFRKTEGEPKVTDLHGSGQIEKDANELFIWHRPAMDSPDPSPQILRVGKLILSRNRHGEMGVETLDADMQHLRFQTPGTAF